MKELSRIYLDRWIIFLMTVVPCYHGSQSPECPYDINASTRECLAPYHAQERLLHVKRLFMGVDVEVLRSTCTALFTSVACARDLLQHCPESQHDSIEDSMSTILSMFSVCTYPDLYEIYARNMNCYWRNSAYSEQCYEKFRAKVEPIMDEINMEEKRAINTMCSELNQLESCVQTNVQLQCQSDEAGELVPILIHPAVHKSTLCEPEPDTTPTPRNGKPTNPTKAAGFSSDNQDSEWSYSSGSQSTYPLHVALYAAVTSLLVYTHGKLSV